MRKTKTTTNFAEPANEKLLVMDPLASIFNSNTIIYESSISLSMKFIIPMIYLMNCPIPSIVHHHHIPLSIASSIVMMMVIDQKNILNDCYCNESKNQ